MTQQSLETDLFSESSNPALSDDESQGLFSKLTLGDCDELPCGYIDPTTGALYRDVVLDDITGIDEDTLANERLHREGIAVDRVLANTIAKLGPIENPMNPETGFRTNLKQMEEALKSLRVGDRYYLLLKLRADSLSNMFEAKLTCPACGTPFEAGIDLNGLEVKKLNDYMAGNLIFSGKTDSHSFKFKVMTGGDEKLLKRILKEKKEELTTALLFLKLVELDNEKPSLKRLKMMSSQRRNAIRKATLEAEGGVETELTVKCQECNHSWRTELPIGQRGFFFPSGV